MKTSPRIGWILTVVIAMGLMGVATIVLAQPPGPPMGGLEFLKNALQKAGAPALTSEQETSIKALIADFRSAHQKPPQNTALQDARTAYENAILNGDNATAAAQAQVIATAETANMAQRETDSANFAISVIAVLKTESGQLPALISSLGSDRVVRLLLSLAGGPRGFGPRGGGPGPGRGFRGPMGP